MKERHFLVLCVLCLWCAFALRVGELETMPRGMHNDEAANLMRAWRLSVGDGMPPFFEDRPEPFHAILLAGWFTILPATPFMGRLFSIFVGMVAIASLVPLCRFVFQSPMQARLIALVAMLVFTTMPTAILLQRAMYRANFLPLFSVLALAMLFYAMRHTKRRYAFYAGLLVGCAIIFYLSGIFFLPIALLMLLVSHRHWSRQRLVALMAGFALPMVFWLALFLTIPNWLTARTGELRAVYPWTDLGQFLGLYWQSLLVFGEARPYFSENMRYSVLSSGYLLAWFVPFAVLGVALSTWHFWRKRAVFLVIAAGVFIVPTAIASTPEYAIRSIGAFGFVAILVGYGVEALLRRLRSPLPALAYLALLVGSVWASYHTIQHHFKYETRLLAQPESWYSLNKAFNYNVYDVMQYIKETSPDTPLYFPIDHLNRAIEASLLLPTHIHTIAPYRGETLPNGEILLPLREHFAPINIPVQYVLINAGRITLLPPIPLDIATTLEETVHREGTPIDLQEGTFTIAHHMPIRAQVWATAMPRTERVLGTFDDTLELIAIDAPQTIEPDTIFPVTLYWRAKVHTDNNYFYAIQPYDWQANAQGFQNGWLLRWLHPTTRWQVGDIIPHTVWVETYDEMPAGAYQFLVGVYLPPADRYVRVNGEKTIFDNQRLVSGQTRVAFDLLGDIVPAPLATPSLFAEGLWIDGADLTIQEDTLTLTLGWQVQAPVPADYTLFVHLVEAGHVVAQEDRQAFGGQYPTSFWRTQDTPQTQHRLPIPADRQGGTFEVKVGMYHPITQERATLVQEGAENKDRVLCLFEVSLESGVMMSIRPCLGG